MLREHARLIWQTGVDAVRPEVLVPRALAQLAFRPVLESAKRILVVGAGKAGGAMSASLEQSLLEYLNRVEGLVNVPADCVRPLQSIRLHAARPAGMNEPTAEGVAGSEEILRLVSSAGPRDIALCLLSGGGSALLPCPVAGISLEEKQAVTRLLHACGATIQEMNAVRKHLSRIKGGRLAQAFQGGQLLSMIISDVIGDPLDVIASGPTAADSSTFADALEVLRKYQLEPELPAGVLKYLRRGSRGEESETLKSLPPNVHNQVIGNNATALAAAASKASELGYHVISLGSNIDGETRVRAAEMAKTIRGMHDHQTAKPVCLLTGGETTVTLSQPHGQGGRNQEFALALLCDLGRDVRQTAFLCGGTDGEDGPTDAAGAFADSDTLERAEQLGLHPADYLVRHDAYHFFDATGDLLRTGLTETNVMDLRVVVLSSGAK
jgi:hydroxypyruvate reductase/glycerate 2-kinase